ADSLAAALRGSRTLPGATTFGPFARTDPPAFLAREPLVVGAAFGLRAGERSGPIPGERGVFIVQVLSRTHADSARWVAQRDAQRQRFFGLAQQGRFEQYLTALREQAEVVDRRKELFRTPVTEEPVGLGF
ncbi:MAG: peptidylprolyl isomerase, partial [Gemmatimonadales bacterium]